MTPAFRLYRLPRDHGRRFFSFDDAEIPLVPGVVVICDDQAQVDAVLAVTGPAELKATTTVDAHGSGSMVTVGGAS